MADLLSAILFSNARPVLLIMLSGYVAQKAFLNSRHDNVGHNLHGDDHCNAGHLQLAPPINEGVILSRHLIRWPNSLCHYRQTRISVRIWLNIYEQSGAVNV